MAFREMLDSRVYGVDSNGKSYGTRVFQVDATTEAAALANPSLPAVFSAYPSDTGCLLDKLEATPEPGFAVYKVVASYSSDGSQKFAQFDPKDRPGYFKLFSGLEDGETEVPIFIRKKVRIVTGGTTQEVWTYIAEKIKILRGVPFLSCEVVTPILNINQLNVIAGQVGKLHTIPQANGRVYLFTGAKISEYERYARVKQIVRYIWTSDSGNGIPQVPPTADGLYAPTIARQPYEKYFGIYPATAGSVPTFKVWKPYDDTEPLGWRTLPFMPNLT